jgi:hypothetical protein
LIIAFAFLGIFVLFALLIKRSFGRQICCVHKIGSSGISGSNKTEDNLSGGATVSDWVTFLSNEKGISFTVILGLGTAFVAFVGIVVTTQGISILTKLIIDAVLLIILIYFFRVMQRYGQKREAITALLREILTGKLNDLAQIRDSWIAIEDANKL